MKVTNIMNFIRTFEPRDAEIEKKLFATAKAELGLSLEMDLPSTFLLQYDALCDEKYVELFRAVKDNPRIELGFWYEVVEPLTTAIGIPYNSARGYRWDWNIDPGFPMSYDTATRERLIDEAMRKFKEIFGFYPRTVASWVLDTYTVNYLADNYEIDAFMICRDQINTDAYTMVGGYFNGAYYPSRNNIFTPGGDETRLNIPVFRLLGPDPIHNYDGKKHLSAGSVERYSTVFTLEPASSVLKNPKIADWLLDTYYCTESIGLAYTQVGQENSFANIDLVTPLRYQYEGLIERGVPFMTVSETARLFKKSYKRTPVTTSAAMTNWDDVDIKCVYYNSEAYTANIFYREGCVSLRSLYLFDDRIEDSYLHGRCTTFDSIHENMPIVDTYYQRGNTDGGEGIILDTGATQFTQSYDGDILTVSFGEGSAIFDETGITLVNCKVKFTPEMVNTRISVTDSSVEYEYKSHKYALRVEGCKPEFKDGVISLCGDKIRLTPEKR